MNTVDLNHIFRCRLAANILYKYMKAFSVSFSDSNYFDLVAIDAANSFKFGIKVGGYDYASSKDFKESYIPSLMNYRINDSSCIMPICLMGVNENTEECKCGIVMSVRLKTIKVFAQPIMKKLNKNSVNGILNSIKESDYIIRSLSDDSLGILKTITMKQSDNRGRNYNITTSYLRNFSYKYKMDSSERIDEKETFERFVNGIPQNEYPSDILDNIIYEVLVRKYGDANVHNSLFLFNTDMAQTRTAYERLHKKTITISVEPTLNIELMEMLGEFINIPRITLTLYTDCPLSQQELGDEFLTYNITNENWIDVYNKISVLLSTIKDISKILD